MKQNKPFFSIIFPVYNQQTYLEQSLQSILQQSYRDFEIIAVNDGSTDESLKILQNYASKYPTLSIVSQKNQGLSCARNTGLAIANGQYITFVDSDDIIHPNYLQDFYNAIIQTQAQIIKNTNIIKFDKLIPSGKTTIKQHIKELSFNAQNIKVGCNVWCYCIENSFLQHSKVTFLKNRIMEDEAFMLMLFPLSKKIFYFKGHPYFYRQHSNSIVATTPIALDRIKNFKEIIAWYEKHQILETFPIPFYILYDVSLNNPQCSEYFQRSKNALAELQLPENLLKQNHLAYFLSQNEVSAFQEEYAKSRGIFKYYTRKTIKYFRSFF